LGQQHFFDHFRIISFDCYGTLIDWETGLWTAFQPILIANDRADISKAEVLQQFAELESQQQRIAGDTLYPNVLEVVHAEFADVNKLETTIALNRGFAQSVADWPVFPDTVDALRRLKSRYELVVLSNVDRAGFAMSNRKLGVDFDAVYTAEDIGFYKPNLFCFEYMFEQLWLDFGVRREEVLHVAQSIYHDHAPARQLGLASVWIDRQHISDSKAKNRTLNWGATAAITNFSEVNPTFYTLEAFSDAVLSENYR
tara:strand:+ start:3156 stop:3920 length:765 start_codon:yes stop_codon:yes gene_type:complete